MAHVVSGIIRKAPFIKDGCGQGGQSKMYAIELSEVTTDYQTKEKSYANYKALFFAKSDAAKGYYDKALAENSFVVVSCEKLKVEQREHNGTVYVSLVMDNARLEAAKFDDQQWGQPQQQPTQQQVNPYQQQQSPQQWQQQQQVAKYPQNNEIDFSDEIPF